MLLVALSAAVAAASPIPEDVTPWVEAQLELGRVRAVVVGVREGDVSTFQAYGWRDAAGTEPVEATDVFELGSITKTFTAALFADAILRGEVRPDTRLSEALGPEVVLRSDPTLAALATHHSGFGRMPCHTPPHAPGTHAFAGWTQADLRRDLATCPVGEGGAYAYSNLGFAALGLALATRTGAPWASLLEARLLTPMGLTGRIAADGFAPDRMVAGWDGHQTSAPWQFDAMSPAGGLRSDAAALLEWGALHQPDAVGPWSEITALATAEHADLTATSVSTGYAWFRYAEPAREGFAEGPGVVGHGGSTGYFHAQLLLDPTRVAVVLVAGTDADDLGFHLMRPDRAPLPPLPQKVPLSPEALAPYTGVWQVGNDAVMRVWSEDGHLMARVRGQREEPLWPMAPDVFGWAAVDARVMFRRAEDGRFREGLLVQGASVPIMRLEGPGAVVAPRGGR